MCISEFKSDSHTYSDTEVLVKVFGQRPDNILLIVHEVFESLIDEFYQGVKYEYILPCSDCIKVVM